MKFFKLVSFWLLVKCLCPSSGADSNEMPSTTTVASSRRVTTPGKTSDATATGGGETKSATDSTTEGSGTNPTVPQGEETKPGTGPTTEGGGSDTTAPQGGQTKPVTSSTTEGDGSDKTDGDSCEMFGRDPPTNFNASETATVTCTCAKSGACPVINMAPEANGDIYFQNHTRFQNRTCTATWTITAFKSNFTRRRVQVPLTCSSNGDTGKLLLTFEKKGNGDPCNEDMDCWSRDQYCNKRSQCSCPKDLPSYVHITNKCYPEVGYGQRCVYDEQCITRDSNTLCETNVCKCRDKYWAYNNTDVTCVSTADAAAMSIPNLVTIYTTAILLMALTGQTL